MKILIFSGGLGNQLFCFSFYKYIFKKYRDSAIYGYYPKKLLSEHYGLEIEKWFDVNLPQSPWWIIFPLFYFFCKKRLLGIDDVEKNVRLCDDETKTVFFAFKQTSLYIGDTIFNFKIKVSELSENNKRVYNEIVSSNSVFIHFRKGDYLSERYRKKYEGTCPIEYYSQAVNLMKTQISNPVFYIFSDDIGWVKKHIDINGTFINWNVGENSPIDLFLMSNCKYAIMANSTFSFWGAKLGVKKQIVTYPLKWENSRSGIPNLFDNDWIGIE